MCKPRSCLWAAWKEIIREQMNANPYGGAVSRSVMVSLYPSVPTIEGKKLLNDWAVRRAI